MRSEKAEGFITLQFNLVRDFRTGRRNLFKYLKFATGFPQDLNKFSPPCRIISVFDQEYLYLGALFTPTLLQKRSGLEKLAVKYSRNMLIQF